MTIDVAAPQGEVSDVRISLLVAPAGGRLRVLPPEAFVGGREWLQEGQAVARIDHSAGSSFVRASEAGWLAGMLAHEGEPVREGQPIAWMERP